MNHFLTHLMWLIVTGFLCFLMSGNIYEILNAGDDTRKMAINISILVFLSVLLLDVLLAKTFSNAKESTE